MGICLCTNDKQPLTVKEVQVDIDSRNIKDKSFSKEMKVYEPNNSKSKNSEKTKNSNSPQILRKSVEESTNKPFTTESKSSKEDPSRKFAGISAFSNEDAKKISVNLQNSFIIKNYLSKISSNINTILDKAKLIKVDQNKYIFNQGEKCNEMYYLLSGNIELYSNDNLEKKITINSNEIFGEIGLLCNDYNRKYNAKAINECKLFKLEKNDYDELTKENKIIDKSSVINLINKYQIFNYLDEKDKEFLSLFAYKYIFDNDKNNIFFDEWFCLLNKGKVQVFDAKNNKELFKTDDKNSFESKFYFYILKNLLSEEEILFNIKGSKNTELIIIQNHCFREIFGINYKNVIKQKFIVQSMTKYGFLKNLFNKLSLEIVSDAFKIKEYKQGEIITIKEDNSILFILLDGCLKNFEIGKVFCNDRTLSNNYNLNNKEENIKVQQNSVLLLESKWDDTKENILSLLTAPNLFKRAFKLKYCPLFYYYSELEILDIFQIVEKEQFRKRDIVIDSDKLPKNENTNKIYFVIKGEAKLVIFDNNNKNKSSIKRFGIGNCFGQMIFKNITSHYQIKACSEILSLFSLENRYVNDIMKINEKFKEYITNQEKKENNKTLLLKDISVIKNLNTNYTRQIVKYENEIFISNTYLKTNNNLDIVKQRALFKRKLDHPFLANSIYFVENENYAVILSPYINFTLSDLINEQLMKKINPISQQIDELVQFYGACLFILLDYLHSKRIIHKNINIDTIVIEQNGFIKLNDFTLSKRLTKNETDATDTIFGIPQFTAPEILNGERYSYSCDYWSVGICLYYLYYLKFPFGNDRNDPLFVYDEILCKNLLYKECIPEVKELFQCILNKHPDQRINNLDEIKNLSLFQGINFHDFINRNIPPLFFPDKNFKKSELENGINVSFDKYLDNLFNTNKDQNDISKCNWGIYF